VSDLKSELVTLSCSLHPDEQIGPREGVEYLRAGQRCPHCGLATLRWNENDELACPVCGYGTGRQRT
jgi:ribosomal protein S27AE